MKTIPFDIEKAKAGAKLVTRTGLPARIICYDAKASQPIVGLVEYAPNKETLIYCTSEGGYIYDHDYDLLIVKESTFRPWQEHEVPFDALFKFNGAIVRCLCVSDGKLYFVSKVGDIIYNLLDGGVFHSMTHSLDSGKTWYKCGIED